MFSMDFPRTSRFDRDTVDDLVKRAGPRALVNKVMIFWPRTERDPLPGYFSIEAWSDRSQSFELRHIQSGRAHPFPAEVPDVYIGERSRQLDDPLIELLLVHEFDPTRFLLAARGLEEGLAGGGYGPPAGRLSRGPPAFERWAIPLPGHIPRGGEPRREDPRYGAPSLDRGRRRSPDFRSPERWSPRRRSPDRRSPERPRSPRRRSPPARRSPSRRSRSRGSPARRSPDRGPGSWEAKPAALTTGGVRSERSGDGLELPAA